jgi:hypothetical protein
LTNIDLSQWRALADYSETSGHYVKTLVLKASANEARNEYKVHLVPCFSSHVDAANRLLNDRIDGMPGRAGGLLHWIGQREHIVDQDTLPKPSPQARDRISSFRLPDLAKILCAHALGDRLAQVFRPRPPIHLLGALALHLYGRRTAYHQCC